MHSARPYGLAVYGGDLTDEDHLFIAKYATIVSNFKDASQLESLKYTRLLPDGGFVIIQDAGGVFRAIAVKPQQPPEQQNELTGIAPVKIPMMFSGVIDKGISRNGEGIEIAISNTCAKRLGGYEHPLGGSMKLQRFRCEYFEMMKYMFVPQMMQGFPPEQLLYTQYDQLKAGWYSGAMAETVQIVSGFGRQDFDKLPEDPIERAEMKIPHKVQLAIEEELKGIRLPGYLGAPVETGSIQYSLIFSDTHLVSFDEQKQPWLVRVHNTGVWAMPFPVIPATRTQAFKDYINEVGDDEIAKILERFGAIPSGESFPKPADFYRWVRAGVIIKICDTADFYNHSPYGSTCGWSCNVDGTRLINTCYNYVNDYCYGYTYQIELKLAAAEREGWIEQQSTANLRPDQSVVLSNYLSQLFEELDDTEVKTMSIKYKLRRIPIEELYQRAAGGYSSGEVDYWDNYTCTAIAKHEGKTTCTNSGYLFGGSRLKVPEPFLEGCMSMDFSPREKKDSFPKADTIVYAYYINDELKVIKNFHDERKVTKSVEGNFEDNLADMVVGSWEQTKYVGLTGLAGQHYSTDFDDRQEIAPEEVYTKIIGKDLGYGTPRASYFAYFWTAGMLRRIRYFTHLTYEERRFAKVTDECFIVPYGQRNAAIYAYFEKSDQVNITNQLVLHEAMDPNEYEFWTYDFTWHSFNNATKRTGKPFPVDSNPVWAEIHFYRHNGSARHDFADDGDWIGSLPADVTKYVNPPNGITLISYGGEAPPVEEFFERSYIDEEKHYKLQLSLVDVPKFIHDRPHSDLYYGNSPDRWGNVVYEDAAKIVFGNVEFANISIKNESKQRYRFGYSRLADNSKAHTFIGVINE